MGTFRSIDELIRTLEREKILLKEMFAKRHSLQFRYDYALEMTEYKEERIRFLIENGVIRDTGDCLEMEDVYQKFFEDVLEVNEEINVSSVRDYISVLKENIDYYLKENNETSNPQPIGFRGNLLVKRQKFFYCTYSLGITETS